MNAPDRPVSRTCRSGVETAAVGRKAKPKFVDAISVWLENSIHLTVRKLFTRIPYSVTNVMDVW